MTQTASSVIRRNDIPGIDITKLAMAYCVVAIHAESWYLNASHWPGCVEWIIRMAVPFFFMVTGFFTAKTLERTPQAGQSALLRNHSRRRFLLFLKWSALYLPMVAFIARNSTGPEIIRMLEQYILGGSPGIAMFVWFIYSTAIVFLIMSLVARRRRGLALAGVLFVAAYFAGWACNHGLMPYNIYVDQLATGALGGGIYMFAGMAVYRRLDALIRRRALFIAALLILSAGLFSLGLPLGELSGGMSLLLWACTASIPSSRHTMAARRMSMWIYFTHTWWMAVVIALDHAFGIRPEALTNFTIMASGATLTALALMVLARRWPVLDSLVR